MKQFTQWSYSQVSCWQQCPHRAKLSYLDKVPQGPPAPALVRGSAIHKEAELYITEQQYAVPVSLFLVSGRIKKLQKLKPDVELCWGVSRTWEPCDPFGEQRWLKVILDIHYRKGNTATIIDYKTGKQRPENHQKQMGLYALAAFAHEGISSVHTQLWYVDHGIVHADSYSRTEMGEMQEQWAQIVAFMEADTIFPKKPGLLCKWCPFHGTEHCEF